LILSGADIAPRPEMSATGTNFDNPARSPDRAAPVRDGGRHSGMKVKVMKPDVSTTITAALDPGRVVPITIEGNPNRVVVSRAGKVIADTMSALTLREVGYPPIQYIPREDVDMSLLEPTRRTTCCPHKGDATYFSIPVGGERSVNAVWTYKTPHKAVAQIENHFAFYPDRVDTIEERPVG
jgi:uncharacterized protein (DUF427 family)